MDFRIHIDVQDDVRRYVGDTFFDAHHVNDGKTFTGAQRHIDEKISWRVVRMSEKAFPNLT